MKILKTKALIVLMEIAEEVRNGITPELKQKFRSTPCSKPWCEEDISCAECPLDELVERYVVCDHLLHGDRATDWEEMEGGKEHGELDGEGDT